MKIQRESEYDKTGVLLLSILALILAVSPLLIPISITVESWSKSEWYIMAVLGGVLVLGFAGIPFILSNIPISIYFIPDFILYTSALFLSGFIFFQSIAIGDFENASVATHALHLMLFLLSIDLIDNRYHYLNHSRFPGYIILLVSCMVKFFFSMYLVSRYAEIALGADFPIFVQQ